MGGSFISVPERCEKPIESDNGRPTYSFIKLTSRTPPPSFIGAN